jgi:hypothetical protein
VYLSFLFGCAAAGTAGGRGAQTFYRVRKFRAVAARQTLSHQSTGDGEQDEKQPWADKAHFAADERRGV